MKRKDNSKYIGAVIMGGALVFGAFYAYSLIRWMAVHSQDPEAWTWWVIIGPIAGLVAFLVFFAAWIGWVIVKPKPKSIEEFIREQERKIEEKLRKEK